MYQKASRYPNDGEPFLLWSWMSNPQTWAYYDDDDGDEGLDGKYLMYKSQHWDHKIHNQNFFLVKKYIEPKKPKNCDYDCENPPKYENLHPGNKLTEKQWDEKYFNPFR